MKKWGKMFAVFACLVLALALTGCGGKNEKFTANSWVFVEKTDTGDNDYMSVIAFEKNNKSYTCTEKTTNIKIRNHGGTSLGIGAKEHYDYKVDVRESAPYIQKGLAYDEKTDSLTMDGDPFYTYMSKDNTIISHHSPTLGKLTYKKATKEEIEEIKKELIDFEQKKAAKATAEGNKQ